MTEQEYMKLVMYHQQKQKEAEDEAYLLKKEIERLQKRVKWLEDRECPQCGFEFDVAEKLMGKKGEVNMPKVFLGGTCNGSTWREELIPWLTIEYFNPVVEDWTPDCQAEEIKQRQECDFVLYTITSEMTGVYSIAEAVDDSNKRPEKTLFCVIEDGFTEGQIRSLDAVAKMITENGGKSFNYLPAVAKYIQHLTDF